MKSRLHIRVDVGSVSPALTLRPPLILCRIPSAKQHGLGERMWVVISRNWARQRCVRRDRDEPAAQYGSSPDSPLEGTGFEPPVPRKTPGLWPISTRTTRRDGSRKREFGSDSRLLAPRCGGSGGLGGGLCVPFPTPGDGQQESGLEPIGRHLVRLLRGGVLRTGCFSCSRRGDRVGDPLGKVGSSEFGILFAHHCLPLPTKSPF